MLYSLLFEQLELGLFFTPSVLFHLSVFSIPKRPDKYLNNFFLMPLLNDLPDIHAR